MQLETENTDIVIANLIAEWPHNDNEPIKEDEWPDIDADNL
jgi:hypothetical protein